VPPLCPGHLATDTTFLRAVGLLVRGLGEDAAQELGAVASPEQQVVATSHAVNQGIDPKQAQRQHDSPEANGCGPGDAGILIALLLDRAGARREGHWRLRTEFAETLERFPTPRQVGLFRAAYPLAFRDEIAAAEREQQLPDLFLQALAREESAFDAKIVSWAGAYGLTQLLLRTGQRAGEMLKPPVVVTAAEQLLEPALNARLGGAFMGSLMRRYEGNPALSLVAYNASERFANILWKRHINDDFDVFAEEISIRETRGYVMRVLKTFGVYRWLYGEGPPELPVALRLPDLD
jgi:soluble lytic murein transglycosylase